MKKLSVKNRLSVLKSISKGLLIATTFLLVACGSDDEANNAITADGKVDVSKGLVFKVNFADYNSTDSLQTRSAAKNDTLSKEVVELNNGLLAEVTIKKDTENLQQERTTTRALADDTYTMLAYQGGVLKGTLTGSVTSGVFTPNTSILIPTGTYNFVLFNSAVSQNGNLLTINRINGENAFIGRTTHTIASTPSLQEVPFDMQHAVARVKIKLSAQMDILATTTATLSSINDTDIPSVATYDASTGVWTSGAGASTSQSLTFPASTETTFFSQTYTSQSNEYSYFLPSTNPSKLKLKFTGGTIYRRSMSGAQLNLSVPTLPAMATNGSYVINVKLMYSFLYLMSDGTTGYFYKTTYGGGTKTPIGLVVDANKRLAMALKEAYNEKFLWRTDYTYPGNFIGNDYDSIALARINREEVRADMNGYKYTWEAAGSSDGTTIKGNSLDHPAFYYAGHYGDVLATELATKGIQLSGGMESKKWHLPSVGEWECYFNNILFADPYIDNRYLGYRINGRFHMAKIPFAQVGGSLPQESLDTDILYWASTQVASLHPLLTMFYGYETMPDPPTLWWEMIADTDNLVGAKFSIWPFIYY